MHMMQLSRSMASCMIPRCGRILVPLAAEAEQGVAGSLVKASRLAYNRLEG